MTDPTHPETCNTMTALRREIDRLDDEILDLLAHRLACIDRAIVLKGREDLPARTTERVKEVVQRVRDGARQRGIDADLVERLWLEMIEWAIAHEETVLGPSPD